MFLATAHRSLPWSARPMTSYRLRRVWLDDVEVEFASAMLIIGLGRAQTDWSVSVSFAAAAPEIFVNRRQVAFRATTAGGSSVRGAGVIGHLPSISAVTWTTVTGLGEIEQSPG
jgi:hypothetical protein